MHTRPNLSWSDLRGARVGVWGLGVEGHANLRRLQAIGASPVLVDDDPAAGFRSAQDRRTAASTRYAPARSSSRRPGSAATARMCEELEAGRHPGSRRARALDAGGRPRSRRLHHGNQGQVARRRPSPDICCSGWVFAASSAAISASRRGTREAAAGRRLLGHRDVQLPGDRPARRSPRRRRDLAAPGPSQLARRSRHVLPRQAVDLHPSRRARSR